jgi:CRISPR-associated DxTHG motif protein
MARENELVTVFRSADSEAEEQAATVRDMLANASIEARVFDDSEPGVLEGAFEVRVPLARQADAERLIDAQREFLPPALDLSHGFDMVPVFASDAPNAEMLATGMRSVLEAQGIPSLLVSGSMFPSLPFEIRVPQARLEEARKAIAAAEEAGPSAAEEGERETEGGPAETSV